MKKAIVLILLHKAELVAQNKTKAIRTVTLTFPWPSVIRLKTYISVPYKNVILTRKNILKRDGHKCVYCGRSDLPFTIDHVIPKSKGGADTWENLVAACLPCNNKKGNRTPEEAGMTLRTKPYRPNHILYLLNSVNNVDVNWKPYLFQD